MHIAWKVFAALAALLHVLFFLMESVLFTQPAVQQRLMLTPEQAETLRLTMFNQGFYNLFLALGCAAGVALAGRRPVVGRTLAAYACACMLGAGVVLLGSEPRLAGGAAVQALPPLLALVCLWRAGTGEAPAA